jgi:hypothetical protein
MTFNSFVKKCTRHFMSAAPLLSAVVLLFSASSAVGATDPKDLLSLLSIDQRILEHVLGHTLLGHILPPNFNIYEAAMAVQGFRDNGLKIPDGSECENILMSTQVKLKRILTNDEIRELLPKILSVTGEQLEVVPQPNGRRSCFTAQMKVLTPNGEVPISALKAGDAVISVDLVTGQPVTNIVNKVIVTAEQEFGTLISQQRPLEVTVSEPFFTDGGVFKPLAQIPETGSLFLFDEKKLKGLLVPVPRGEVLSRPQATTVYNLELVGEPRNFVIEGLLVHNKPVFFIQ